MPEKYLIELFNLIALAALVFVPFLGSKRVGILALSLISLQVILAFTLAFGIFSNGALEYFYNGSFITGEIPVRIDYLSAWFILIISFTFCIGAWYGFQYMKQYREQTANIQLHAIAYILTFTALIDICMIQNAIAFLVVWEIMAIGSFILVIFEHYNKETLRAGINYFVQAHISILLLTLAFIWIKGKTGSFDFNAISAYTALHPGMGMGLFILFFVGFAIKAGFVPFHTWLPLAHPAAPAHISGVMSGVIIKIGIFGMLRMLTFIKTDFAALGYFILIISIISGLYGVMLAIIQHNLKRLLAYHSIENIGIIGIGIGLGCLGRGMDNHWLSVAGFGGALLHTLNHSLFKSLLFFSAGNVYQVTQTMNIESLGGLIKKLPHSAFLFLIGALAICGLPPFNGFVSEFFIFSGLFSGMVAHQFLFTLAMLFSVLALVLIGGLALICFTKAFGIVFLGTARKEFAINKALDAPTRVWPLYLIALLMLFIGIFPYAFSSILLKTTGLLEENTLSLPMPELLNTFNNLAHIGVYSLGFLLLIVLMVVIRKVATRQQTSATDTTWGCAYPGFAGKMQYSASSFIRTYRKLTEPLLSLKKEKKLAAGLYPDEIEQITHPYDKLEYALIDKPIYWLKRILSRFVFLQNGNIQYYILYGFIFIVVAILLPLLVSKTLVFIHFLNQL